MLLAVSPFIGSIVWAKAMDVETFGTTALHTKLRKDKVLSSNEHFSATLASEVAGHLLASAKPDGPEAKVDARLLSSKALASEVAAVVTSLRNVISPPPKVPPQEDKDVDGETYPQPKKAARTLTVFAQNTNSGGGNTDDSEDVEEQSDERELSEEDDGVDDGGWESGSMHEEPEDASEEEDNSSRGDDDEERDNSDDVVHPPKKLKSVVANLPAKSGVSKATPKSTGSTASTFLPSLAVGFTRGDSDSEPEDIDGAPKKNRRGQRARRAYVIIAA